MGGGSDPLSLGGGDPLGGSLDPLASFAAQAKQTKGTKDSLSTSSTTLSSLSKSEKKSIEEEEAIAEKKKNDSLANWKSKKAGILSEFTTDDLMGVTAVCYYSVTLYFLIQD